MARSYPSQIGTSQTFNQGDFIPITILYANVGGTANAQISLTLPNGTVVNDFTHLFLQPLRSDTWSALPSNILAVCGPAPAPPPTCSPNPAYTQFYNGAGYLLGPTDYGNYNAPSTPPIQHNLSQIWGQNTAIAACGCYANSTRYGSYKVWYSLANKTWDCQTYRKPNNYAPQLLLY